MILKNKKLIVLRGTADSGKTITLNYLIDMIIPLSTSSAVIYRGKKKRKKGLPSDKCVVVTYKSREIAIITAGDNGSDLDWYFNEIDKKYNKPIDFYVCASHLSGSTIKAITDTFKDSVIVWENKWAIWEENNALPLAIEDLQNQANEIQAQVLLETIDRI